MQADLQKIKIRFPIKVGVCILVTILVNCILYSLFFSIQNRLIGEPARLPMDQYLFWFRAPLTEYDGIESYALYSLLIVNIFLPALLCGIIIRFMKSWIQYVFILLALLSCVLLVRKIPSFTLPMETNPLQDILHPDPYYFPIIIATAIMALIFLWLDKRYQKYFILALAFLLIPVCFIYTTPLSFSDYNYVFAPAMRLLDGVKISQIYFQYDLLLSLIAAGLFRIGAGFNAMGFLSQVSYYLLILFLFLFAKKMFVNKTFPVLLLMGLVIIKVYANIEDPIQSVQVTPLRLDLWLILLWIVYEKGMYSKLLGGVIGLLIIVTSTFGIIYLLSYFLLICASFLLDTIKSIQETKRIRQSLHGELGKHVRKAFPNISIILISYCVYFLIFQKIIPEAAGIYSEVGIGFLPISKTSFYWFLPPFFAVSFILLILHKNEIGDRYYFTGVFLLFLSVGNLIYFFGRSHENNILNVGACLLLVFFMTIDLVLKNVSLINTNQELRYYLWIIKAFPFLCILILAANYSGNIYHRTLIQAKKLIHFKNLDIQFNDCNNPNIMSIRKNTNNSEKVYFASLNCDSIYYYYGGYIPISYQSPFSTWMVKKDLVDYLQKLLDDGYYIAIDHEQVWEEISPSFSNVAILEEEGQIYIREDNEAIKSFP